jgi:hypothetical protein
MPEIDGRVILLIVFVAISAIKWLMEKIQGGDQPSVEEESNDNVESLYDQFREEIRQRQTKLQKNPAVESPPPLPPSTAQRPQRVQHAQQRQIPQRQERPIPHTPPEPQVKQAPSYVRQKTKVSAEQKAAAARFEQRSGSQYRPSAQKLVRGLLSNPESTRQAIILSEILGKPKSVQGR